MGKSDFIKIYKVIKTYKLAIILKTIKIYELVII